MGAATLPQKAVQHSERKETVRWADFNLPIPVYITPLRWYEAEKRGQAHHYYELVYQALETWSEASGGLVRFSLKSAPTRPGITLRWQRVTRQALGYCHWKFHQQHQIIGADLDIGLTDGLLFQDYNRPMEVYHVILHELGHALGLQHTDNPEDILYGGPMVHDRHSLSINDINSIRLLYQLPPGTPIATLAEQLELPAESTLDKIARELDRLHTTPALHEAPISPNKGKCRSESLLVQHQALMGLIGKQQMFPNSRPVPIITPHSQPKELILSYLK